MQKLGGRENSSGYSLERELLMNWDWSRRATSRRATCQQSCLSNGWRKSILGPDLLVSLLHYAFLLSDKSWRSNFLLYFLSLYCTTNLYECKLNESRLLDELSRVLWRTAQTWLDAMQRLTLSTFPNGWATTTGPKSGEIDGRWGGYVRRLQLLPKVRQTRCSVTRTSYLSLFINQQPSSKGK